MICLDNYFTGRKANIAQWIGHPRFELIRHDVTEPIKLEVDRIWHLACPASPIHYQFNPVKTAKTSFLGTYNMLGLARWSERGCCWQAPARCMATGAASPAGELQRLCEPDRHPQLLQRGQAHRRDPLLRLPAHEWCGRAGDADLQHLWAAHVADDGRVVSNFIVQALRGEPLTLYGDGPRPDRFAT